MNKTIDYYNQNAADYISKTLNVNMSFSQNLFLHSLPNVEEKKSLKILDIGAGSGRETAFFNSLGYDITALEPSEALAEQIRKNVKCPVLQITAQELNFENHFDGIIAFASLLHIPKNEFKDVLQKIHQALKPEGVFFMTLKKGYGESHDNIGRFFSYYQQEEIQEILTELHFSAPYFAEDESQIAPGTTWINTLSVKSCKPVPKINQAKKKF